MKQLSRNMTETNWLFLYAPTRKKKKTKNMREWFKIELSTFEWLALEHRAIQVVMLCVS